MPLLEPSAPFPRLPAPLPRRGPVVRVVVSRCVAPVHIAAFVPLGTFEVAVLCVTIPRTTPSLAKKGGFGSIDGRPR